jgi:glucose-6-phosphate 1-dehydrogenase
LSVPGEQVLRAVQPIRDEDVVLGQYEGYKDDPTVPKDSVTPTFASIILRINNERWDGVPFIMKAGKALDSRKAEIRVQFKDVPGDIFKCQKQGRNEFVMRLQPSEAMYMKLTVKQPGLDMKATQSELDLSYQQRYQDVVIPEAYERLILDTYILPPQWPLQFLYTDAVLWLQFLCCTLHWQICHLSFVSFLSISLQTAGILIPSSSPSIQLLLTRILQK